MDLASEFVSSHLARPSASGGQADDLADLEHVGTGGRHGWRQ